MLFPLTKPQFEHHFGVRLLGEDEPVFLRTSQFEKEIKRKRQLLAEHPNRYAAQLPESEDAAVEVRQMVSADRQWNQTNDTFATDVHGSSWSDDLKRHDLIGDDLILDDLISAALSVQEDLVICGEDPSRGFPVIAGVVCFPSGWSIQEKIGLPLASVHAPVPELEQRMGESITRLMQGLRPERPVWRSNWGVRPSGQLDQSPSHHDQLTELAGDIDRFNAGRRCWFRVERQTLSRLPSGPILFTIHTMTQPIDDLSPDEQRILLGVLTTCPTETRRYKGIQRFYKPLVQYLEERQTNQK